MGGAVWGRAHRGWEGSFWRAGWCSCLGPKFLLGIVSMRHVFGDFSGKFRRGPEAPSSQIRGSKWQRVFT